MKTITLKIKKDYAMKFLEYLEKSDAISLIKKKEKSVRKIKPRKNKKGFFLTAGLWKDRDVKLEDIRAKAFPPRTA